MSKLNDLIEEMAAAYCQGDKWYGGLANLSNFEKDLVRDGIRRALIVALEARPKDIPAKPKCGCDFCLERL